MEIMGNSIIVKIPKTGKMKELNQLFKQPEFIDEKHQKAKNNFFVLWFFSTPKDQNGIISKNECTPVVIKENIVIGKNSYCNFTTRLCSTTSVGFCNMPNACCSTFNTVIGYKNGDFVCNVHTFSKSHAKMQEKAT